MLRKRGEIWYARIKAGGKTIERSTGTSRKREAQEFERNLRIEVARELHEGRTGVPVERTYGEALLKWITDGAPKSMYSHARNTRPYLDDIPLHLVVPAAHQMRTEMVNGGLSRQTVNRRLAVVRRVLNVAYKEWDWVKEPLGQKIQLLSEKGMSREFYLSQREVQNLADATSSPEAYKVIMVAAYTGLRRGELIKLVPDNWQDPYIVLGNDTKSKKPRTVPVIDKVKPLLTLPFKISDWDLRKQFETARESIGRPDIRFHDLRHTYASWLAKNPDIPLATLRDLLGHSSLSVTSKYTHLRGDTFDVVSNALNKSEKKGETKQ